VKPDIENRTSLNLEMVTLKTVQVARLPLKHKICRIGMICSAKPVVTEDLFLVQKQEFFNNMVCAKYTLDKRPSIFITDNPIFSSERMLHKD
jgi:hypothetical protein